MKSLVKQRIRRSMGGEGLPATCYLQKLGAGKNRNRPWLGWTDAKKKALAAELGSTSYAALKVLPPPVVFRTLSVSPYRTTLGQIVPR